MGAEEDAILEVMAAVDVLFEQRIEIPVQSLDEVEGDGVEIAWDIRHRGLSVAMRDADNAARTGRSCVAKSRQGENPLSPKMLEKSPTLFILGFPCRPFPLEQFVDGFGQFGETEAGEILDSLMDECEFASTKITA